MNKTDELINLDNKTLLEGQNNIQYKEDNSQDKNLETIYFNLINDKENKNLKINGIQNLLILLEYIFYKTNEENMPNEIISKKKDILNIIIEELVNNIKEINEKIFQEKLGQYFYHLNFSESFFEILYKKEDISSFKEIFLFGSKVSKYNLLI